MSTLKLRVEQNKNYSKHNFRKEKSPEEIQEELKEKKNKENADRVKLLLENVFSQLDLLNGENFDNLFPILVSNMKEAAVLREDLIKEVGPDELIKNRPELFFTAKQIEKKYDSIVKLFSDEEKRLERELASLYQKKKLTVYQR